MTTLGDMISRIGSELNRTGLDSAIRNAILSATTFYAGTRLWFNEARASTAEGFGPTANGTEYLDLPADFEAFDSLTATISGTAYPLDFIDYALAETLAMSPSTKSQPGRFTIYAQKVRFVPVVNGAYPLTLSYIKRLTDLAADTDTNAWMVEGEALIRERAKAYVRISQLRNDVARMEAMSLQQQGSGCLSLFEQAELRSLQGRTSNRISTGRLRPTSF